MYHESFGSLPYVPDGSPGYAHPRNQGRGCRNRYGDRFAGAVLLTEMLVWHDPALRQSSVDVSVFDKLELCRGGPKFDLVRKVLQAHSAELATLFERTWDSPGLSGCPRLAEWATAMAIVSPADGSVRPPIAPGPRRPTRQSTSDTAGRPGAQVPRLPPSGPPRDPTSHAPTCPLRPPSAPTPVPDKSSFSGVPTHDHIGFIPLFSSSSGHRGGIPLDRRSWPGLTSPGTSDNCPVLAGTIEPPSSRPRSGSRLRELPGAATGPAAHGGCRGLPAGGWVVSSARWKRDSRR